MSCVSLEEGKITGGMRRSFVEVMAFEFHLKAGQDLECENWPGRLGGCLIRIKYFVSKASYRAILTN